MNKKDEEYNYHLYMGTTELDKLITGKLFRSYSRDQFEIVEGLCKYWGYDKVYSALILKQRNIEDAIHYLNNVAD